MAPGETSSSSSSSLADEQVEAIREMWPTALKVLKAIPAAHSALQQGAMSEEEFYHSYASQSLVDCGLPQSFTPVGDKPFGPGALYSTEACRVLVEELKARLLPTGFNKPWKSILIMSE